VLEEDNESVKKQAYIGRFKRSLLSKLKCDRYSRYIDRLNEIVADYNDTKHRSLKDTPNKSTEPQQRCYFRYRGH
jgi:hypothetical protein